MQTQYEVIPSMNVSTCVDFEQTGQLCEHTIATQIYRTSQIAAALTAAKIQVKAPNKIGKVVVEGGHGHLLKRDSNGKHIEDPQFDMPHENENARIGTITRKHSKFDFGERLVAVPVEIEIDSTLYHLIQNDILKQIAATADVSLEEWINVCFSERMEQIITDPKEWGKVTLNAVRRAHCLPEVEWR